MCPGPGLIYHWPCMATSPRPSPLDRTLLKEGHMHIATCSCAIDTWPRGVRHQPKSCTRFRNPKISGKISDFSHFTLKTFCSFLLCYHSNNKLIQLLADFSKQRIKYLVLNFWFLTHALMRNYTVSSLVILEILNCP